VGLGKVNSEADGVSALIAAKSDIQTLGAPRHSHSDLSPQVLCYPGFGFAFVPKSPLKASLF
jgi:hypothetical protein